MLKLIFWCTCSNLSSPRKEMHSTHPWRPRQLQSTRCPPWSARRRCISQHASVECCESWCRLPTARMFEIKRQEVAKMKWLQRGGIQMLRCTGRSAQTSARPNDFCPEWLYYNMEEKGTCQGCIKTAWGGRESGERKKFLVIVCEDVLFVVRDWKASLSAAAFIHSRQRATRS